MTLKGLAGGLYRPLSAKDIETIHDASLTIIETTGFTYKPGLDVRRRARAIARRTLAGEDQPCLPADTDRAIRKRFDILL